MYLDQLVSQIRTTRLTDHTITQKNHLKYCHFFPYFYLRFPVTLSVIYPSHHFFILFCSRQTHTLAIRKVDHITRKSKKSTTTTSFQHLCISITHSRFCLLEHHAKKIIHNAEKQLDYHLYISILLSLSISTYLPSYLCCITENRLDFAASYTVDL